MRRIKIFDTTLRDGEQSPGIALRPSEKGEIALALERLGVDVIEAGFAAASPGDFDGVAAVSDAVTSATVASLARTTAEDIDAAVSALASARRRAGACVHRDERLAHGAQARAHPRRGARARPLVGGVRRGTGSPGRVLGRRRHALRPGVPGRSVPRRRCGGRDDRQPARHSRLQLAGRVRPPVRRDGRAVSRSSPGSSSRFTATTTSAWPLRTRSPVSKRERPRSSARSTGSANVLATHRSRKSRWRCVCARTSSVPRPRSTPPRSAPRRRSSAS